MVTRVTPVTVGSRRARTTTGMELITIAFAVFLVVGILAERFAPARVGDEAEPYTPHPQR